MTQRIRRKPAALVAAMAATASLAGGAAVVATSASAAPVAPAATTNSATAVSTTSETVQGTVNPNGTATGYRFDYGTTTGYGSSTPEQSVGTGTTPASLASSINGLTAGTTYHYRIVALSPAGTTDGADQTFVAGGTSAVSVLGREGFVSPGNVIGIQMGCFGGVTTCSGNFTVTAGSTVVGQHAYSIAPNSGGFHNFKLTPAGANLLASNSVFHLLGVTVTVKDNSGQTLKFVVHLARWFWHS